MTDAHDDIPRPTSPRLLLGLLEAAGRGASSLDEVARTLEIDPRTALDAAHFARWLGWIHLDSLDLTADGWAFLRRPDTRAAAFQEALWRTDFVRKVHARRRTVRDSKGRRLPVREILDAMFAEREDMAEATAVRRSRAIARAMELAEHPERLDWRTGRHVDESGLAFRFEGRSFLTALDARRFGNAMRMLASFPRQVLIAVYDGPETLAIERWGRASWTFEDSMWFGGVPITRATRAVLARRGQGARALLVLTVPYIAMLAAIVTFREEEGDDESALSVARDLFGLRIWKGSEDLGALERGMHTLARVLGLKLIEDRPDALHVEDCGAPIDELVELCEDLGLLAAHGASLVAHPEWRAELEDVRFGESSLAQRLALIHKDMALVLPRWRRDATR
ncbi:MAG: hypothetical protein AAGI01_05105 [Myxococcota bacterium]